jgi:hypothetical protein
MTLIGTLEVGAVQTSSGLSVLLQSIGTTEVPILRITFDDFFTGLGTSTDLIASQIGVDRVLFRRVDQGRQPLPLAVAKLVVAVVPPTTRVVQVGTTTSTEVLPRVHLADVLGVARSWTPLDSPLLRTPLPPDTLLGDTL